MRTINRSCFSIPELVVAISVLLLLSGFISFNQKPVLYLVGDSTVQNNDGNGKNDYWGWGTLIKPYFDSTKISIENHAKSGTSTRTFMSDGRWLKILENLKAGDYVIIQFGHNDQAVINDSSRAKGTLKGTGDETEDIFNLKTQKQETVHTYGWYLRKFIRETKEKGAIPIVCSLVPREKWKGNKVNREIEYVNWAQETANTMGAGFVNLNEIIVNKWEQLGADKVKTFFPGDHTHTNLAGAEFNAASFIEGLKNLSTSELNKYLKK